MVFASAIWFTTERLPWSADVYSVRYTYATLDFRYVTDGAKLINELWPPLRGTWMMMHEETRALLPAMAEARDQFMELVAELRPELHRYCARMTGSIFDGEDAVQDTLAKAYYALGQMREPPNLKPWLFRIAHNTAIDFVRRHERKDVDVVPDVPERAEPEEPGVDPVLVEAALTVFVQLPPVQRGALILKDVLGHSLEEVATTLGISVGAVKAALWRARANLARMSPADFAQPARAGSSEKQASLRRYAALFNGRNWEACLVDGAHAIAMFRPPSSLVPAYFVLLEWTGGRISLIRDFRYVPYIANDARFSRLD